MKTGKMFTAAFVLLALMVAQSGAALVNVASGVSYEYSAAWPGTPSTWGDTTPPTKLTDGDEGNLVIENGNEPFVIFNFDFGSDVDLVQLKGLAIETPWNNNTLEFIDFHVRTEASGSFTTGYASIAGEADWSMTGVAVDKSSPTWVVDTGTIAVTGRYLTIWADNTTNLGKTGLTEIQAMVIPEPATLGMVVAVGGGLLWIRRKFMI